MTAAHINNHCPEGGIKHEAIPGLNLGWINLLCPRCTKVFAEVIRQWQSRKDRASVTNPLPRLLGIFFISQPFVHVPEIQRENDVESFGADSNSKQLFNCTSVAPAVSRDCPSLSACSWTPLSHF